MLKAHLLAGKKRIYLCLQGCRIVNMLVRIIWM